MWCITGLTAILYLLHLKSSTFLLFTFLHSSFYCRLLKKDRDLKFAKQFSIGGLVGKCVI